MSAQFDWRARLSASEQRYTCGVEDNKAADWAITDENSDAVRVDVSVNCVLIDESIAPQDRVLFV